MKSHKLSPSSSKFLILERNPVVTAISDPSEVLGFFPSRADLDMLKDLQGKEVQRQRMACVELGSWGMDDKSNKQQREIDEQKGGHSRSF